VIPKCFVTMFSETKYEQAKIDTKTAIKHSIAESVIIQKRMGLTLTEARKIDALVEEKFSRKFFGIGGPLAEIMTIFSSMFIHGGIMHLIGNMWFLWVFGNNVEDDLGISRFIIFYFFSGIIASLGHIVISAASIVPTIGASGAISGVLGAYLLMYPNARILTFIPIGWFLWMEELPAWIFLGYWFVMQLVFGVFSQPILRGGGVAWGAHIAGFFAGVFLVIILAGKKVKLFKTRWSL